MVVKIAGETNIGAEEAFWQCLGNASLHLGNKICTHKRYAEYPIEEDF